MNPAVAVLILCQPSESEVTALTLHHLARDLGPSVSADVLMNGGLAGALQAAAPPSPHIRFHSSPTNLGVAGGRNYLLRLPSARAADVIVILDNDVITPPGHIDRLVTTLLADPRAGVVGPAILQLAAVAGPLGLDADPTLRSPIENERLARLGPVLEEPAAWFHLGTAADWWAAYIDEVHLDQRLAVAAGAEVVPFHAMNHEDPAIRSAVAARSSGSIDAANVAGCCQVFRRDLLDSIGFLRDEYSPYGFEDVDFCVRAIQAGRRNFVDPAIVMLHGTDRRHAERRTGAQLVATQRNHMRCKALFAWHHGGPAWEAAIEASIIRRYMLHRQTGRRRTALLLLEAHTAGVQDARRQIRHAIAAVIDQRDEFTS